MLKCSLLLLLYIFINFTAVFAQCPPNIGFERGNFDNWETLKGQISREGVISLTPITPDPSTHRILSADINGKEVDQYGGFPVVCPNGSGYSVKLGMEQGGADAHGLNYTFTVPQTNGDYSIIYNYAVVLENPPHQAFEQPKLSVSIFNVTDNKYEDCGSFQFIASADLPGFKRSNSSRADVFYKDWAPITIKLQNYAGKTLRLEFTVNDCALTGHFGYAYIDINENCTTPITGNVLCNGTPKLTLTAPYGFMAYKWFTEDFSQTLGINNTLKLNPAPAPGTRLALEIVPYPNQGCLDTLYTTVTKSDDPFDFVLKPSAEACETTGIDITSPTLIQGSTPGMAYNYFADFNESEFVSNPKKIITAGTYYIKATNTAGCTDTKPFDALVWKNPVLKVKAELPECIPNTVNLTNSTITQGSEGGLQFSYWTDEPATKPLSTPTVISKSGIYYIKATTDKGCSSVKPVDVSITAPPLLVTTDLTACGNLMLSNVNPIAGSDPTATPSYWSDAAFTSRLATDHVFTKSTNYYVQLKSVAGCTVSKIAKVTINPIPEFTVTNPATVRIPQTINLINSVPFSTDWTYSYWQDSATTKPQLNPERILKSGTYYAKSTNVFGCTATNPIVVNIEDALIAPSNIFSPNGDGINDTWKIPLIEYYPESQIEIFNRYGQLVNKFIGYKNTWDGKGKNGKIVPVGVYYYLIWQKSTTPPISGSVTIIY